MDTEVKKEKQQPGIGLSLFVFLVCIAILLVGIVVLQYDIHILLLVALAFACLVSAKLGYSFDDLVECMKKPLGQAMPAMIIFIFIGLIIAAWISSGTVPSLVVYGLRVMKPAVFLPVGFLLCCVVSFSIGTSWGTVGTMGIVMMGIGLGMGIPAPMTAGMVLSGAAFGDKMSPMSDTTNLAAAAAGTTLYKHIGSMWRVTFPSFCIVLVAFILMGRQFGSGTVDAEVIRVVDQTITANFHVTPVVLIPVAVLLLWNIKRLPAIPGMAVGTVIAVIIAVAVQGMKLGDVINALNYGYSADTGVEIVNTLINRGGIQKMMYTFSLACIAISFGGVMERVGYLRQVVGLLVNRVKNDRLMVPIVIASTFVGTFAMGEVYLSIILVGNLYRENFRQRGLRSELLSRLLEEGGTLMCYFVPWSTSAVFVSQTLGVSVRDFAPYALLNWVNPLLSIILALCGIFVLREAVGQKGKPAEQ